MAIRSGRNQEKHAISFTTLPLKWYVHPSLTETETRTAVLTMNRPYGNYFIGPIRPPRWPSPFILPPFFESRFAPPRAATPGDIVESEFIPPAIRIGNTNPGSFRHT